MSALDYGDAITFLLLVGGIGGVVRALWVVTRAR